MPTLNEIEINRKKEFKKRDYRPWNIEGNNNDTINFTDIPFNMEQENLKLVNPLLIKNWEFHDRPENELGDIEALAKEFKEIGQQQPCIVRPINNGYFKFELIVGERRWHAAKLAEVDLKVIVKNISDSEAALIQASENLNRKGLSDYARGLSYCNLINNGIIQQSDLIDKLCLSKQQVSRLLSFSKIPHEIIEEIRDMSQISARTAEQIKQLSNKGQIYIDAIKKFATKLREGNLGHEKLSRLVELEINSKVYNNNIIPSYSKNEKVFSKDGNPIFVWRFNKKAKVSIDFSDRIALLLYDHKIDHTAITDIIREYMEKTSQEVK
jgi:ParB family transcriptional regulator, chromosome partitioning protein